MSRIRSEFTGTILTSIDESHHLHCSTKIFAINFSKRIKLTEFDETYGSECLQDKMSYENNLIMTVFRQSPANSGPFMKILEFAASFENVLRISLTCRRWNYILNKNEVTCEGIWHRITKQVYDPRDFEELERIYPRNSYCDWKQLIRIKEGSELKVYQGIMGKLIQRLLWVFLNQRIEPYSCLYWTDDFVECTLSIQAEKLMRYGGRSFFLGVRERGIFQFDLCIEEDLFRLGKGRFVKAVYRDHAYTLTHLQEEGQKIHQWCNVVGLTANDYKIEKPKRQVDALRGSDGVIRVKIFANNWQHSPHIRFAV